MWVFVVAGDDFNRYEFRDRRIKGDGRILLSARRSNVRCSNVRCSYTRCINVRCSNERGSNVETGEEG